MPRRIALLLFVLLAAQPAHAEPFETAAPVALLVDEASGMTLLARNADKAIEPAAMAKMMTVAVVADALAAGETSLETDYPVSETAWRKGGAPSGAAAMFAALKSRVRVADLLRGVAIQAANDACLVLAEGLAGGEASFVERMNVKARQIGLAHTTYTNATGFADPAQTTTARDLAALLRHLVETRPAVYALYGEKEFTWNRIRQLNRNPLLATVPGTDGGVTGASDSAGYGLAASALRDGRRLILVLHGLPSAKVRAEEAARIMTWGFDAFAARELFAKGETAGNVRVFGGSDWTVPAVAAAAVVIPVRRDARDDLTARLTYDGPVRAPVKAGDAIARLDILRDGVPAFSASLVAGTDVPAGNLGRRAIGAFYELMVGLTLGARRS